MISTVANSDFDKNPIQIIIKTMKRLRDQREAVVAITRRMGAAKAADKAILIANENTNSTAIFTTSTADSTGILVLNSLPLYTTGSHPIYKPAMEEAEYIEKGHIVMISSLENATEKENANGSFSLIFSDDFYDIPLSGHSTKRLP